MAASGATPPAPFGATPSPVQVAWNALGYYGFCHFTVNTFTGREWGYGDEDPKLFNPTYFDAEQIVRTFKQGGMKGVVLTAKHHDGFCLWPSTFTGHSVKNSPWMNGHGDVVKAIADACHHQGMLFGVYLSPWDRNRADYGTSAYLTYYRNQLRELLTNYGKISILWLDGANGGDGYYGGAKEKRTIPAGYYDWPATIKLARDLQPGIAINGGNDYRWIGNEAGVTPDPCWSTIGAGDIEKLGDWRTLLGHGVRDGARWCGAETDVSIRPGWYYHASQNSKVKAPAKLMQMVFDAVGHGQCLILNLPPDTRGRIADIDVRNVTEAGHAMAETFATNLVAPAKLEPSNVRDNDPAFDATQLLSPKPDAFWATDDSVHTPTITIDFGKPTTFDLVRFGEYIPLGQRIAGAALELWDGRQWTPLATAPSVGYERLIRLDAPVTSDRIRIRITACPAAVTLRNLGVFLIAKPVAVSTEDH